MVDKDVPCAVVFQVGDLEAAGVANLGRLEGGVEGLDFHQRFGIPGLRRGGQGQPINNNHPLVFLHF